MTKRPGSSPSVSISHTRGGYLPVIVGALLLILGGGALKVAHTSKNTPSGEEFYELLKVRKDSRDAVKIFGNETKENPDDENPPSLAEVGAQAGEYLTFDQINPYLIVALISIEDTRFREHNGFDRAGTPGLIKSALSGDPRGGSGLGAQMVKNVYFQSKREKAFFKRLQQKLEEWVIAGKFMALDDQLSKRELVVAYLNDVEFYPGTTGIQQGANALFGKSSRDLTFDEAVMLISMAQNPTLYHPRSEKNAEQHTIDLEKRTDAGLGVVFETLKNGIFQSFFREKLGMDPIVLTESELKMLQSTVTSQKIPKQFSVRLPGKNTLQRSSNELIEEARQLASGEPVVSIETTIDRELQETLIHVVQEEYAKLLKERPHKDVPLYTSVLVVNKKGEVLSDVRGDDFLQRPLDFRMAEREMGSVVKFLVDAAALELGIITANETYEDIQYTLTPEEYAGLQSERDGKNFGDFSNKFLNILQATLVDSRNSGIIYQFKKAYAMGMSQQFIDLIEQKFMDIGEEITDQINDNPMAGVGAGTSGNAENLVKMYAPLVNEGKTFTELSTIKKVRTSDGLKYSRDEKGPYQPEMVTVMADSVVQMMLPYLLKRGEQVLQEPGTTIAIKSGTGDNAEQLRLAITTPGDNGTITSIGLGPGTVGKGRPEGAAAGNILRPLAKAVVNLLRKFGYAAGSRPEREKFISETDTLELQPLPESDTLELKQLEKIEWEEGTKEFNH